MNTPIRNMFSLVDIESYIEGEFLLMFFHDPAFYVVFYFIFPMIMILVYVIHVPHMP
jgi:hypothetical protein